MYLDELDLHQFRNLADQSIGFKSGFNYLYGDNGAGKTAVLEAIYLLARGRSFRTHKIAPLIQEGADSLLLRVKVESDRGGPHTLAMSKAAKGDTQLRLDHENVQRASVFAQHMPVQTLLPDAGELVVGSPGIRRGFLDWGLFHVEQSFLECSRQFRRVLAQRNAWLKTPEAEAQGLLGDPWFEQHKNLAIKLSLFRQQYTERLGEPFTALLQQLAPELQLRISYDWGGLIDASNAEKKMSESWLRDVKFGKTHRGPQRGDLIFWIGDQNAAETVSRGQAKLIASAAILAQVKLLYALKNIKSLVLIDDFGAELDPAHWRFFLDTLLQLDCQVIATSTLAPDKQQEWAQRVKNLAVFHVEHGVISPALSRLSP